MFKSSQGKTFLRLEPIVFEMLHFSLYLTKKQAEQTKSRLFGLFACCLFAIQNQFKIQVQVQH